MKLTDAAPAEDDVPGDPTIPEPPIAAAPAGRTDRLADARAALAAPDAGTLRGPAAPRARARTARPAAPTRIGAQIGDYRLVEELGAGGMGTVYVGRHRVLGRQVAIKILADELHATQSAARFLNEARAAVRIAHPAIVDVFHFGITPDRRAYMVMELLAGESLDRRLHRLRRLSEAEAIRIARRIAEGLAAAHAAGVVHRDLKPANVFLAHAPQRGPDRVKLIDFGIAKLSAELAGPVRTAAHAVMGTPTYMAPEQARASVDVDARTDLYALGCILFEMVSGAPPFTVDESRALEAQAAMLRAHQSQPPPPLPPELASPALAALVQALLAKRPAQRPPSARAVIAALDEAARALRRRRRPWLLAPALLGAALGATVVTLAWREGRSGPPATPVAATSTTEPAAAGSTSPGPAAARAAPLPAAPAERVVDAGTPQVSTPPPAPRPPRVNAAPPTRPRPRTPPPAEPIAAIEPAAAGASAAAAAPTTAAGTDDTTATDADAMVGGATRAYFAGRFAEAAERCAAPRALDATALPAALCAVAACRAGRDVDARAFAATLPVEQQPRALRDCAGAP